MEPDRAAAIRAVLGDDLMGAMDGLRIATAEYTRYFWRPFMPRRRIALFAALEEVMALHVNRIVALAAHTVTILQEPIADHEARITTLEDRERGR